MLILGLSHALSPKSPLGSLKSLGLTRRFLSSPQVGPSITGFATSNRYGGGLTTPLLSVLLKRARSHGGQHVILSNIGHPKARFRRTTRLLDEVTFSKLVHTNENRFGSRSHVVHLLHLAELYPHDTVRRMIDFARKRNPNSFVGISVGCASTAESLMKTCVLDAVLLRAEDAKDLSHLFDLSHAEIYLRSAVDIILRPTLRGELLANQPGSILFHPQVKGVVVRSTSLDHLFELEVAIDELVSRTQ